ncbi:MAG: hypothetical protein KA758_06850 [Acidimicrobiales bacterium]|nr:hypothetical protein [Acidimicrobiales bacterium]
MTLEREHAILTEQNGKLRAEVRRLGAELATSRALHLTEQARVSAGESWDKRKVRRQTREVNRLTRALRRYQAVNQPGQYPLYLTADEVNHLCAVYQPLGAKTAEDWKEIDLDIGVKLNDLQQGVEIDLEDA